MADEKLQAEAKDSSAPEQNQPGAKGVSTTKMDLDQDYTVNGVHYEAGKGVEVNSAHRQALDEMGAENKKYLNWSQTHHGAVPAPAHPQEATAQTPTRPLAGPEIRQPRAFRSTPVEGDMEVVDDNGNAAPVKDKDQAEKVNQDIEKGKTFSEDEQVKPGQVK